jgi:hypothetical protein
MKTIMEKCNVCKNKPKDRGMWLTTCEPCKYSGFAINDKDRDNFVRLHAEPTEREK